MSYTFKQNLVSSSKYSIKCPYTMSAIGFCVHNTSNNASAENEIKYMISNNNQVSYHYAVDEKHVIQGLPTNRNAWAAGDGANGSGNRKYIHIEICRSTGDVETFKKCEQNCAEFLAKELKARGWGIDKVKKHQDFSNKYCPHKSLDLGWQRFLNMVQSELDKLNKPATSTTTSSYKVGDKIKVKTTATHYATGQSIASFVKGSEYQVTKVDGNKLLLSSISSWVWDYDVEKVGATSTSTEYKVKIVNCTVLNVRKGAGTNYAVATTVKAGEVCTIVGETNGWLKLKSGAGYISKSYTQKI